MPIAVITEELKSLNEYYLQEVFNYILYLKTKQNSQSETVATLNSFVGSLPQNFDEEKTKDSHFVEKYNAYNNLLKYVGKISVDEDYKKELAKSRSERYESIN